MARATSVIYNSLVDMAIFFASSVGLTLVPTNWSKADLKRLFLNTFADGQAIQEQLYDSYTEDVEEIASFLSPQTYPWFNDRFKNLFEYDAIAVPIIQLSVSVVNGQKTLVPYYPTPNANFRIVKHVATVPGFLGTTLIKIAADSAGEPVQIVGDGLSAAQTFANTIGVPGLTYNVVSLAADRLFMQLDVYYNGQYSSVIQTNVINAIKAYLLGKSTTDFNGSILLTDIQVEIKKVAGVYDVVLVNVQARADTTTVGTGTNLVLNKLEIARKWDTVAGHIVPEDTSGANWMLTDYRVGASGIKNLHLIPQ